MSPRRDHLPKTAIHNLSGLFKPPPGEPDNPAVGFPEGSTILVTGRPGSGKSFFALSLAREHLRAYQRERKAKARLIFVGVGADRKQLEKQYGAFGWFVSDGSHLDPIDCEIVSVDETTLPQPAAGAEELITPLLTRLRRATIAARADGGETAVFVVFDSLTSMVKGSATGGERQRYIQELIRLTKAYLGNNKKLCVLTADAADAPDDGIRPERETAADFVFHVGFRDTGAGRTARVLDVRKCPEHTPMLIGRHSWEVLHPGNIKEAIAPARLRHVVLNHHAPTDRNRWGTIYLSPYLSLPDVGKLQSVGDHDVPGTHLVDVEPETALSCGIPGLDEMLVGDQDYWSKPTRVLLDSTPLGARGGLYRGSVTFLIGRAGTGKSNSCLQFLLAADKGPRRPAAPPRDGPDRDPIRRRLYVNFENLFSQVLAWYPGDDEEVARLKKCRTMYRRRTQFDFAHFTHELYFLIKEYEIERVAFDGLTDLAQTDDPQAFEFFLEELIALIRLAKFDELQPLRDDLERHHAAARGDADAAATEAHRAEAERVEREIKRRQYITIFVSLEADPDSPDAARYEQKNSPADNVIIFRQVKINDERRKTVEVRKARGRAPDRQVRELVVRHKSPHPLRVVPGLDNYRHVTDGQPEPVRVALQLVGENRAAGRANLRLADRLDGLFGYPLTTYEFARGEIARTLRDIAGGADRIPTWDVKLFHVDEWWVRELRVNSLRPPDRLLAQTRHSLMRLNAFLATDPAGGSDEEPARDALPTEFWAVEMEKGCVPVVTDGKDGRSPFRADVIALPGYADFGLFCVQLERPTKSGREPDGTPDRRWRTVLDTVPRVWATESVVGGRRWFAEPTSGTDTVVDDMLRRGVKPHAWANPTNDPKDEPPRIGFAFDMATPATAGCGFLELCWAFGASEDFLIRDVTDARTDAHLTDHPAVRAMSLLMFLVAEGLMPPRTTLADTRRAVFSRHWYSSLPFVDDAVAPRDLSDEAPAAPPGHSYDAGARRPGWVKRPPVEPEDRATRAERVQEITVFPVPFFPLGVAPAVASGGVDVRTRICLHDAMVRFGRLLKRIEAAVEYRIPLLRTTPDDPAPAIRGAIATARDGIAAVFPAAPGGGTPGSFDWWDTYRPWVDVGSETLAGRVDALLAALAAASTGIRDAVLESPLFGCGRGYEHRQPPAAVGFDPEYPATPNPRSPWPDAPRHWPHLPYAMFLDVRDVLELLKWHDHRVAALRADGDRRTLGQVVFDDPARTPRRRAARPAHPAPGAALSGFGCQGSWLVGADRTTRSPNLSAKFLTEMTSLESCQERAWLGAGIPPRKDFYEYYGNTPVPCTPDPALTWNKLLVALGARARRRSRTFCARTRVSLAFVEIDRLVFDCLTRADVRRTDYRKPERHVDIVGELTDAAAAAVRRLFAWVREEMREQYQHDRDAYRTAGNRPLHRQECVTCPNRAGCESVLADGGAP